MIIYLKPEQALKIGAVKSRDLVFLSNQTIYIYVYALGTLYYNLTEEKYAH